MFNFESTALLCKGHICEYLDLASLGRLASVNKSFLQTIMKSSNTEQIFQTMKLYKIYSQCKLINQRSIDIVKRVSDYLYDEMLFKIFINGLWGDFRPGHILNGNQIIYLWNYLRILLGNICAYINIDIM